MISGGTLLFPLMMFKEEALESFSSSLVSLRLSSEACLTMEIFRVSGTGGVDGWLAFMLNLEPCLIIMDDLLEESSLISLRLARGASGLLTGLFLVLMNFAINSLERDFLSLLEVITGDVNESSGEAILVVDEPRKMPEMVCINVFFWLFCC